MSVNAELFAIGKFQKKLADCLDYPENLYKSVKEGAKIATMITCCNTSTESDYMFDAFDVGVWDLGRHWIGTIPEEKFKDRNFKNSLIASGMSEEDFLAVKKLAKAGFQFFLMPNG